MFAYGAIAASSALRVIQGLLLDRGMDSLLPADIFLDLTLRLNNRAGDGKLGLHRPFNAQVAARPVM